MLAGNSCDLCPPMDERARVTCQPPDRTRKRLVYPAQLKKVGTAIPT